MHKFLLLKKILIIRFSSIGDIVLTSPIIRCVKKQIEGVELHYCTKLQYIELLNSNPYIDQLYCLDKDFWKLYKDLKREKYDFVIDLHKSLRSRLLRFLLLVPGASFPKLNFRKWLLVNTKVDLLPALHVVDRYFEAVKSLAVKNDGLGLEYFFPVNQEFDTVYLPETHRQGFVGFVIGGRHHTKIFPASKVVEVCKFLNQPVVLLGGREDHTVAEEICRAVGQMCYNACGQFSVNQSAQLVRQARLIITNDTGLMHIAAVFGKKIISVWGSTVPKFGMYPYINNNQNDDSLIIETHGLKCRPCSKIGYKRCPKKHFDCMNKISGQHLATEALRLLEK